MDVFPWQLLFSSMPYMQKNIFLRKGFWSKYHFLTNFSPTISHTEFCEFDDTIDIIIRNSHMLCHNNNEMVLYKTNPHALSYMNA